MRQINELLRTELAAEIMRSVDLPNDVFVSITKVDTSPDLHNATIFVSIVPDNKSGSSLEQIKKNLKNLATNVAPRLSLRTFPRLKVKIDEAERRASHIEALLDSLK